MAEVAVPSETQVLGYFDSLSNWGRWGDEDQLGTLNFMTPKTVRRAVSLIQEGHHISCERTIQFENTVDSITPPVHFMIESGEGWATGDKVTNRVAEGASDFFGMAYHGYTITHIDSLCHFFWQGKMYNNRPAHLVSTNHGATVESVEVAGSGILGRGVLVDVPMIRNTDWVERGEGVMPEDILAAEQRCGFTIEEGDILLVRTGNLHRRNLEGPVDPNKYGSPACQAACLPLFHDRKIAVLGTDTGNDVLPAHYTNVAYPIHQVGLVKMGLWILDNADLEELSKTCTAKGRWTFMLNIAPLKLSNSTGSPVNPVAIF